jgi:hypothetical protein
MAPAMDSEGRCPKCGDWARDCICEETCEHDEVLYLGETPTHGPTSAECEGCGKTTQNIDFDVDFSGEGYYTPIWAP